MDEPLLPLVQTPRIINDDSIEQDDFINSLSDSISNLSTDDSISHVEEQPVQRTRSGRPINRPNYLADYLLES